MKRYEYYMDAGLHEEPSGPWVKFEDAQAAIQAAVLAEREKSEHLRSWLLADAYCPCCGKDDVCAEGCTFEHDCHNDFERISKVRELLAERILP